MRKGLYCFTHDLRLEDNPTLNALARECESLAFVYIINPQWFKPTNYHHQDIGFHRWRFICQSLEALARNLSDSKHRLYVAFGSPKQVISQLTTQHTFTHLGVAHQVGWYEQQHWRQVAKEFNELTVVSRWNSTLFEPSQLPDDDAKYKSFSRFRNFVEKKSVEVQLPQASYGLKLRAPMTLPLDVFDVEKASSLSGASQSLRDDLVESSMFHGGELSASRHLRGYFSSQAPLSYKETRNALDDWSSSTKLSPYLSQGNLSPRQVWLQKLSYEEVFGANESTYWIGFELLWREYFQWQATRQGTSLFTFKGVAQQSPLTSYFPERFNRWVHGSTPSPLVNACMNQLRSTGYLSNRGRQLVASYLTNELNIDWRYGAAYFQEQLIDYDVAANWGNWQYIAGVGVDPRGGRHFNIEKQQQQYDPDGSFIARWSGEQNITAIDSTDAADWPVLEA
ncbi:cryptochrome DASH [Thalassotalea loyana]|uniref:Cryptochrome DASH n=1 Tax=Thalassotalea loyana TaxID=280483 RepID=A0ABQ6HAH1_9GAMM|nr:DASH family cryptochrome [Thalassotalea loyana]GLX85123.1 cryptochrome DASH [Thalassotalea loyana]